MTTPTPTLDDIRQVQQQADCLLDRETVLHAIARMAKDINQRLADRHLLCISILNGGLIPAGLLLPHLDMVLQMDTLQATRYREQLQGKELIWKKYPDHDLTDRCILLVDDILDQGITLQAVLSYCQQAGAAEVYTAVLLDKPTARHEDGLAKADFVGLEIPDRYVFGFGLDYKGYLRNADGIYAI